MLTTASSITTPSGFTNFLLAELRCASARARLIATEVDSVAVALGGGFIDIISAFEWLGAAGAMDLITVSSATTSAST